MARAAFKQHYREIGIYKAVVMFRVELYIVAILAFVLGMPTLFGHEFKTFGKVVFAGLWIFLILVSIAGAIDHIFIGLRIKKILRELASSGVFITKNELLFYCRDLIH
jgi:hypothetical protein